VVLEAVVPYLCSFLMVCVDGLLVALPGIWTEFLFFNLFSSIHEGRRARFWNVVQYNTVMVDEAWTGSFEDG